ncbi:MAG: oligoendopeptidase family protein [Phenylobacterium sp.]|nr:oligoendopeptidase family protein [Phenylobacterium sp.]
MTEITRRDTLIFAATAAFAGQAWAEAPAGASDPPAVWNLADLYPSDTAWDTERAALEQALPGLAAYKGRLGESAETLRTALQAISDLNRRASRLATYAGLEADENLQVAVNQERRQRSIALLGKFSEATAWVNPEVLRIGPEKINAFLAADPGLAKFRFGLLDTLRLAPHTLDAAGEGLIAATLQPLSGPQEIRSQLFLSDIPWPEIQLSTGKVRVDPQGYTATRTAPDRADRKRVFDGFFGTMTVYESSLGAALSSQVQGDIFGAKARRYDNAAAAALSASNIPLGVYRTLVEETNRGLPVLQRYLTLRQRMLNLPSSEYYDIYPPATKLDRRFSLGEIRRLTLEAVQPLGPDYVKLLGTSTAARWMHARPQKGKAAGAYMNPGAYDVHPYLLLNLTDDYESLTTFAHEWGHAMHSLMANKVQPYETSNYATFIAEIASTLNEQLLAEHMFRQAKTTPEKLFYLDRVAELLRGTFFRQAMFGEFELTMHETAEKGEPLSGKRLSAMYLELLRKYHSPAMHVDEAYAIEWAYVPHFYYDFYVFQYATSVSASAYFTDKILTGGKAERENYLNVLRAGGSDYPVAILKRAGLDMTTAAPYRACVAKLSHTLDRMEALLGKG